MRSNVRRLPGETVSMTVEVPAADGTVARHYVDMNMAYVGGVLHEIAFVGRSKIGSGFDLLLQDLSIKASRAIQGRDPDTGDLSASDVTADRGEPA